MGRLYQRRQETILRNTIKGYEVKTSQERLIIWQSKEYQERVLQLEADGCCTSDAQGIADVEFGL